jgi:hypothetical protein
MNQVKRIAAARSLAKAGLFALAAAVPLVLPQQAAANRLSNAVAVFSGLDKITGRITTFDVYVNETVQFGALQVTPKVCYSRDDQEAQKIDSFVEVDEITLNRKIRRIFTGWMFADSPGLNAVEHAIYDVWLKGCKQTSDVPPPDGFVPPKNDVAPPDPTADSVKSLGTIETPNPAGQAPQPQQADPAQQGQPADGIELKF